MDINNLVMIVAGCICVVAGVGSVLFRVPFATWNKKNIEARFGQENSAFRRATPRMMVGLGIFWTALGCGILLTALTS